jgi:phosphatidylglycerophosphatase A
MGMDCKKVILDFKYLGWGLLIILFAFALLPTPTLMKGKFPVDKLLHAGGYFFLTLSFLLGYRSSHSLLIALLLFLLGSSVEGLQILLPWRNPSLADLGANTVGILTALAIPKKASSFRFWEFFATVAYIGKIPWGPGTFSSLVVLILYALLPIQNKGLFLLIIPLTLLGIWSSSLLSEKYGDDPKSVVIDEAIGMLVALLFHAKNLSVYVSAFLLFRLFDVWKPWFVRSSQGLPAGLGIVMDDLLAGGLANLGIFLILFVDKIIGVSLFLP